LFFPFFQQFLGETEPKLGTSVQVVIISQNGINETCKHYRLTTRKDMKPVNRGYEKGYIPVLYAFISKETPEGYKGYDGWLPVNV